MAKNLLDMSLEELWQLFPIILTPHQQEWKKWYLEESSFLKKSITNTHRISHIGSTAIPSIWAKPIIDILLEVPKDTSLLDYKDLIEHCGYICMSQTADKLSFNKGYTNDGFADRVFHLHLRYAGDNDELYFRDYLIDNPDKAKDYETLKLSLWQKYKHNRDGYTNAKGEFVQKYTTLAKRLYNNKYQKG